MKDRSSQAGFSSIELICVAAVMSILMVMVAESMRTLAGVRGEQRVGFQVGDVSDRVARKLTSDVEFASRVFSSEAADLQLFATLDLGVDLIANGCRLPKLTSNGAFEPDPPGLQETGNVLFVARRGDKLEVGGDEGPSTRVQTYEFCVTAPMTHDGALDLRRFVSEPLLDYAALAEFGNEDERKDALQSLHEDGANFAWDPTAAPGSAFYVVTEGGDLEPMPTGRRIPCAEDDAWSRPFSTRRMRVAANGDANKHPTPLYARPVGAFPGGFELKLDGAQQGKLLLLRMVVEADSPQGRSVRAEIRRLLPTQG